MSLTCKQNRFVIDVQKGQTPAAFKNLYSKQHAAAAAAFTWQRNEKIQRSENVTER